jgi:hypothetical protein
MIVPSLPVCLSVGLSRLLVRCGDDGFDYANRQTLTKNMEREREGKAVN